MNLSQTEIADLVSRGATLGPTAQLDMGTAEPEAPKVKRPKVFVEPGVSVAKDRLTIVVPTETVSESNSRSSWVAKSRRTKSAKLILFNLMGKWHKLLTPWVTNLHEGGFLKVTLIRMGGRELDDDNLRSSLKATRDAVAALLLIDDRDKRAKWEYEQYPGEDSGVMIEISS